MTRHDLLGKCIHFVGIGGIGMSGLAQLLKSCGHTVTGSDLGFNGNVERLEQMGIPITIGHGPSAVEGKDLIVVSTDIKADNPELQEAHARRLPILHRADLLALLMESQRGISVSGTHGKTTTTALIGWVLEKAHLDPTVINGGIMNGWDSNVKDGRGDWCVAEADESDGSFLKLPCDMAVITNIEPEHMDHYGSLEKLLQAFETFAVSGTAVLGIDHPHVYALWQKIRHTHSCVAYGIHEEADIRATDIVLTPQGADFQVVREGNSFPVRLSLYGRHNIANALGAAAVAFLCGIGHEPIQQAFASFSGVQRRFTRVGEWKGVTIIDDYAHHPTEIRATLAAAKDVSVGRIIAVLEPHRYTRVAHHFNDFAQCCEEADLTIVLPIYAAREAPLEGVTHQSLAAAMKGEVYCCDDPQALPALIQQIAQAGDMLMCLGAGSISALARALPTSLGETAQEVYG